MPRLIVMEGNTIARQKQAADLGVRSASGIYLEAISDHFPDIELDVIHAADRGQELPKGASMEDYDAMVVGGSGLHAYDTTFEVQNQIELLKEFAQTGKPILGSCWGLQIAVIAGGGTVELSPNGREVGVARKLCLNEAGRNHPLYRNKNQVFDAACIHYDEVSTLPPGSTPLCSNAHSDIQGAIVPLGKSEVWAVQYHPEFDVAHISKLFDLYAREMVQQGFFSDEEDAHIYKEKLDAVNQDRQNSALRWQLGIDDDILDDRVRRAEIINWIESCVLASN